jgi:hypothetical protein
VHLLLLNHSPADGLAYDRLGDGGADSLVIVMAALCANISETSCPSTITVGRGKKSHFDEHKQDKQFFRCVGSFGA